MSVDGNIEYWALSDAIDPFGALAKANVTPKIGVFVLDDCELRSDRNQALELWEIKNIFNRERGGRCRARYAMAEFPAHAPVILSINSGKGDTQLEKDMEWFHRNNLSFVEYLLDDNLPLADLSESEIGILRRLVIVKVPDFLFSADESQEVYVSTSTATLNASMEQYEFTRTA